MYVIKIHLALCSLKGQRCQDSLILGNGDKTLCKVNPSFTVTSPCRHTYLNPAVAASSSSRDTDWYRPGWFRLA